MGSVRRYAGFGLAVVLLMVTVTALVAAVGVSQAQTQAAPDRPSVSLHAQPGPGGLFASAANVEPGGGCSDPEPEECVEDPKTHCPVKGPLHPSGSQQCVPIAGAVIVRVGYPPGGGCNQEEVIQVALPPAGEQFEAAWYSELGLGTRWWRSPGEPSPIANGAASYTVPPGYAGWSGAGGSGECPGTVPPKTFGVKAWALTNGNGAGSPGGGAKGGGAGGACKVPKLKNLTLGGAHSALKRHRCTLGKVKRRPSSADHRGRVISQTATPGKTLPAGAKVGVTLGR